MPFPARGENLKLGKGSLLLDYFDDSGNPTGLDFVGNMTGLSFSWDINQVEKYSSTQRSAGLVDRARTRAGLSLTANCDEWTGRNLQSWFLAGATSRSQSSGTAQTLNVDNVKVGKYYDLGVLQVTNVSVALGSIGNLVLNTDYDLNSQFGMIHVLEDGAVQDGDDLVVTFDKPALEITKLQMGTKSQQLAHLLYLSDDASSAAVPSKDRLEVWKVDIAPEGDLQLISDDYGGFSLTMGVLVDGSNHPDEPYGTLERVAG